MTRRSVAFVALLALSVFVVALATGRSRGDGPPLDPDSTGPLGTRALVELLQEFDVTVTRGLPEEGAGTALVLAGRLDEVESERVDDWVRRGGRLVVASPGSSTEPLAAVSPQTTRGRGSCDLALLDGAETIESDGFGLFAVDPDEPACFEADGLAFVTARSDGRGQRVFLGGAAVLTNARLADADNAVLALRLLAPDDPDRSLVVVYEPVALAAGDQGLLDLVPTEVRWMGWQLVVAFALFVWFRARRFGRVVDEYQPVELPGSILVLASAELRRRAGGHSQAIEAIRRDLEADLRRRYRLPVESSSARVAETVATRTGLDPAVTRHALMDPVEPTAAGLETLLGAVDRVRAAAVPTGAGSPGAGSGGPGPTLTVPAPAAVPARRRP